MHERVYGDRTILVLGGSSGIGRKAVAEFARAGATVFVGTRKPENFDWAKQQIARREKLNPDSLIIFPFVADIKNKEQIENAVHDIRRREMAVTDVIFSQAGGMESYTSRLFKEHMDGINRYTLSTPIDELPENQRSEVEDKLSTMRQDLQVWTQEAMADAEAVNYHGTFQTMDILHDAFPLGFRAVFLNSTWGDLSGRTGVEIPMMYRPVDRTKAMVRDQLAAESFWFRYPGIHMGVVIASLVNDTNVGKMFNDFFLNLMDPQQREAVRSSSVQCQDVVAAIREVLDSDPNIWPSLPYNLYVYRKGGEVVIAETLELTAMYTQPYRF